MFNPLNNIEKSNINDILNEKFVSYTDFIKNKYNLSNEQIRLFNLLNLEEIFALKLEKMLQVFNGNLMFPFIDIIKQHVDHAYDNLLNYYAQNSQVKRYILKSIGVKKYTFYNKINKK